MKKIITSLFVVFSLLLVTGCEDEPFIKATPQTVSFPQEGGTQTINLSTNSISWTASVSGKGFSVSPSSGSGNATLQLKASAATSSSDGTGTLTVKSGTMQTVVTITQSARNTLIVKGTNSVEAEGGAYTLALEYNTTYSVEVDAAAKSWIQYTGTRAMSTATLEFLIASNPGAPRSGKIEVRDNAGIAETQVFVFEQKESLLRSALMDLYNNLDGEHWNKTESTYWNTNEPISSWGGVTVEEEKLIGLNLSGFGLKGAFPAGLSDLTDLQTLDLSSNNLSGSLPVAMGKLDNLKVLVLSHNEKINGSLPAAWSGMTSLERFELTHTQLEGTIPAQIFEKWKHLHTFKINNNPNLGLEGTLPLALGALETSAESLFLHLHNCGFEGGIPEEWAGIPAVCEELFLYGNKLTEPVPLSIQAHPSWADKWDVWPDENTHGIRTQQGNVFLELEQVPDAQRDCLMALYMALGGENWTKGKHWGSDLDIDQWEGVTVADEAVTGLNLSNFGLKGSLSSRIEELTSLKNIDVSNNPGLEGTLPKELGNLPNLTVLKSSESQITGPLPAEMGNLKKLTELNLSHTNINGTIPKEWAEMTALVSLDISYAALSTPLPAEIFNGWKNIRLLQLNNNPNLKGELPEALGSMTTKAADLSIYLHECNFTGSVPEAWSNLPGITARIAVYENKLTGKIPAAIIQHPCWEQWDAYKDNSSTHYIRSQQNSVLLDLEYVAPTVSTITLDELLYNKITVSATIERQGSHPVTERGIKYNNAKKQYKSGGTGAYSVELSVSANTTYTLQAYAVSDGKTVSGPEMTVTTPKHSELTIVLACEDENIVIANATIYLKQLPEETATNNAVRSAVASAGSEGKEYKTKSNNFGEVPTQNIEPGTYGMRLAYDDVYTNPGIVKDFYTLLTVPEGNSTLTIENIPTMPSTSQTLTLFQPNAGIRPFASETPNDNVVAMVMMNEDFVRPYKGKVLENILFCPADASAAILIIAQSEDQLTEIYEAFLTFSDTTNFDPTKYIGFIENLSKHIIMIENVLPGRTNLISQSENCLKRIMIDRMKESGNWDGGTVPLKNLFTENYVLKIEDGDELWLNLILTQQGMRPVLMTDGDGPSVSGGNLIGLGSGQGNSGQATTLKDLGYNGNWHLGVTVK
jgi:Leucine-rich repeat (LRR) protein